MAAWLGTSSPASPQELFIVEGGASPGGKWAVAVVPQKAGERVDDADGTVYLVSLPGKTVLQELREADSTGGTWGKTTENIRCKWSPDGRFVAVNMRIGRMTNRYLLYQVTDTGAKPVDLPARQTHPKSRIYEALEYTANPGETVTAWTGPASFTTEEYGLRPRRGDVDFPRYGMPEFDGVLEKRYRLENGKWILDDVRIPKPR